MILADAHVHIYDCFDLQVFLDSALANFEAQAVRSGQLNAFTAVLFLAETAKENWFDRLANYTDHERCPRTKAIGGWTFHHTNETCSMRAFNSQSKTLLLIAGRQIVTAQNLEVLALATDKFFQDGSPLVETIQAVKNSGGLPVVPWGFGKWMEKRGRILSSLLGDSRNREFFLGDNSNRPHIWPYPTHFRLAEERGIKILPGSDPFPFSSECGRAGSFGFSLHESISREHPARELKQTLLDPTSRFRAYGFLESPYRFFRNQLKVQIKKQLRKGRLASR